MPSRLGAEDVARTLSTRRTLQIEVTARTKVVGNHCLNEPIPPASRLPDLVSDLTRCGLPPDGFGKQDQGAAMDIPWPEHHNDQVAGNKAATMSCRSETSLLRLASSILVLPCVQWLLALSGFVKDLPRHCLYPGRHQARPTDVALYAPRACRGPHASDSPISHEAAR